IYVEAILPVGWAVCDLDLGPRPVRRAAVRLQRFVPSPFGGVVVAETGVLPILRHPGLVRQCLEALRVGADHQTNDLIGTLLIGAVGVVECKLSALGPIGLIRIEPALGGILIRWAARRRKRPRSMRACG